MKKSAQETQVLNMNSTDFEKDPKRKPAYKFVVNFISGRTDINAARGEIVQSFINALNNDEIISSLLSGNDYIFTLNTKYQLEIKLNNPGKETTAKPAEEISLE